MRVLVACECSGRVRKAFRALGHNAWSCDLQEAEDGSPFHIHGDVLDVLNDRWDLLIAHPVCRYLSNSGGCWLKDNPERWQKMREGAEFFLKFKNARHIPKRCVENPIMHKYAIAIIGGKATQYVHPWWFGEEAFKATGFWLEGLPKLGPTNKLTPPKSGTPEHKKWSFIHYMAPGPDREKNRSRTFQGVADAMALQWGNL